MSSSQTLSGSGDDGTHDVVIRNLKIALLLTLVVTVGILIYGTFVTYSKTPPLPGRFTDPQGQVLMTGPGVVAGKAAFQEADLMDYGSIYGMGSYFGEDYTAQFLHALGRHTEQALAQARYGKSLRALTPGQRYTVRATMREELQGIPLRHTLVVLPQALSNALRQVRAQAVRELLHNHFAHGWTRPGGFDHAKARRLANFLIYSAMTTIARRPGRTFS